MGHLRPAGRVFETPGIDDEKHDLVESLLHSTYERSTCSPSDEVVFLFLAEENETEKFCFENIGQ